MLGRSLRRIAVFFLVGSLDLACSEPTGGLGQSCAAAEDCAASETTCDTDQSICICTSDIACDDTSFCNSLGTCQKRLACGSNIDCSEGAFCNSISGRCLDESSGSSLSCGAASHCPLGTLCREGVCEEGCLADGDCELGEVCRDETCLASGSGQPTLCSNSDFCAYGEICDGNGQCQTDLRGPYCRACTDPTLANPFPCGTPLNRCLLDTREGGSRFCGVDCSGASDARGGCPSGFVCNDVVVLTRATCRNSAECRCLRSQMTLSTRTCSLPTPCEAIGAEACVEIGAPECNGGDLGGVADCIVAGGEAEGHCTCLADGDCSNGGRCIGGRCCSGTIRPEEGLQCVLGEGQTEGFCTCASDEDCGQDLCDAASGSCQLTGQSCTPGADDCAAIACVEGRCHIGRNCAPEEGLTCSQLTGS